MTSWLEAWTRRKAAVPYYGLETPAAAEFEFRGAQWGHPSNFAAIHISASPAEGLEVQFNASLPASLSGEYRGRLAEAVEVAAVDELLASDWYAYRDCSLVVARVDWDGVMSSERALYQAARGAFAKLRHDASWSFRAK